MSPAVPEQIRIGNVSVAVKTATTWIRDYTDVANSSAVNPYAYPAYDQYEIERNDPHRLSDADLLAPGLLNVPVKIRSFYGMQRVRPYLEAALSNDDLAVPLAEIDDPVRIGAMVRPFYEILDDPSRKPWSVNATTLSKVLHRKRPTSLVLHDKWVRACYVGAKAPVPLAKNRSWADYMVAITLAIGDDIRSQTKQFKLLDAATGCPGELTPVRLLDIVAWKSKGSSSSEVADEP